MAPFAEMALAKHMQEKVWKYSALLIVISPLVALTKDQVNRLQE